MGREATNEAITKTIEAQEQIERILAWYLSDNKAHPMSGDMRDRLSPRGKRECTQAACDVIAALTALHPAPVAMKLMPIEPTAEMLDAYWSQTDESKEMRPRTHAYMRRFWSAVLDASEFTRDPAIAEAIERIAALEAALSSGSMTIESNSTSKHYMIAIRFPSLEAMHQSSAALIAAIGRQE